MTNPAPQPPERRLSDPETFGYGGNPWTLAAGVIGVILLVLGSILAAGGQLLGASLLQLGLLLLTGWFLLGGIGWYLRQRS